MNTEEMARAFPIEMKPKKHVRHISASNEYQDQVLFKGYLGELGIMHRARVRD